MGKERVVLKHGADIALVRLESVDHRAIQQHLARGGSFETADQTQGGGFAAAGGAEQRIKAAAFERERDVIHGALAGKILHHVAEFKNLHSDTSILSCV